MALNCPATIAYCYLSFDDKRALHCVSLPFHMRDDFGRLHGIFEKGKDFVKDRQYCFCLMFWDHNLLANREYTMEVVTRRNQFFSVENFSIALENHVYISDSAKSVTNNHLFRLFSFFTFPYKALCFIF